MQNDDLNDFQGNDLLQHFLRHGWKEGRDPAPGFSISFSLYQLQMSKAKVWNPWLVFASKVLFGCKPETPSWQQGARAQESIQKRVVLVAHQLESELFGAELSMLDLLEAFAKLNLNVSVVLPTAKNKTYVDDVRKLCSAFVVLPFSWWKSGRQIDAATVALLSELFVSAEADVVYCNTSVLYEPAVAAREIKIPSICHVREVYEADPALCRVLNSTSDVIIDHIESNFDLIIANSAFTAKQFKRAFVVNNICNRAELLLVPIKVSNGSKIRVGMVSSNLLKKGIGDFFEVAQSIQTVAEMDVEFVLYGPITNEVLELRNQYGLGNLVLAGYVDDIAVAYANLDVVLNLSHFAESFGRTVAEAMAAGKLVITYNFGAVGELVQHGLNGYLVTHKEVFSVVAQLQWCLQNWPNQNKVREIARTTVEQNFTLDIMVGQLQPVFSVALKDQEIS